MAGQAQSSFVDDDAAVMSDINIVPLVDVILVLLIVFMITVPAIVASAPIKVDVPQTTSAPVEAPRLALNLILRREADGELGLYLNEAPTTVEKLQDYVLEFVEPGDEQPVFLAADQTIPYGEVIKIMDKLASMGLSKVSLDTRHVGGGLR